MLMAFGLFQVAPGAESLPATIPAPSPAHDAMPVVQPKIAERKFSIPDLSQQVPVFRIQKVEAIDDTREVLLRLQRAAKECRIMEVWALDPSISPEREKENKSRPYPFHDFHALGREELKDEEAIHKLLLSIILSIGNAPKETYECFDPRHGLRIYGQKGYIDVLLCYTCLHGAIYEGEKVMWFDTAADAQADFDAVFAKLGLKKAD